MHLTGRHAIALSAALIVPTFSHALPLDIEYSVSVDGRPIDVINSFDVAEVPIRPFETAQTIEEFYNYDDDLAIRDRDDELGIRDRGMHPGGRPEFDLRRDAGLVFLHRDTRTGTLGLGMIFDNMRNSSGYSVTEGTPSGIEGDGDGGLLQFMLSGAPDSARLRFADGERGDYVPIDDPDEFVENGGSTDDLICVESDVCAARATEVAYDGPSEGVREPEVNGLYSFEWYPQDTDGFVADGFEGSEWSLLLDSFMGSEDSTLDDPAGIYRLYMLSPSLDGDVFGTFIGYDPETSLRITAAQAPAAVPLPGGLPLMAGAMLGLAALSRRARRA